MMTERALALLRAADPWNEGHWGEGLGYLADLGDVGDTIKSGKALAPAGEKITAAMKAGDVNAVAEGASDGLKAAGGVVEGLKGTWSGAAKFMISVGGTVDVPVFGYKGPNLPMWTDTAPSQQTPGLTYSGTYIPKNFLKLVSEEWLFAKPAWDKFGFRPPEPGGVKGQVWNPFKGIWQGAGAPIVDPSTEKTVKTLPSYGTQTGVDRIKLIQNSVNTLAGGRNPAYGFRVAFEQQKAAVAAKNYPLANQGYLYVGPPRGTFPGLVSTIRVLTAVQYVKTALMMGMTVTSGPLAGQSLATLREGWIKELSALIQTMPQNARPSNAAALALATKDGTGTGPPIKPDEGGGVAVVAGIGLLGLLFMFARFFG